MAIVLTVAITVAIVAALLLAVTVRAQRRVTSRVQVLEEAAERAAARDAHEEVVEQRLGGALSVIPQGVMIFDAAGEVVFSNQPARPFLAARHGDALVEDAVTHLAGRALAGDDGAQEIDLFGPPRRYLILRSLPLRQGDQTIGAVVSIDDVSDRRRLEAVRRDFVANISHELKTPIGALALLAETLLGEDDPAVSARLAERMVSEAHRVGRTIDDLLELSRIEAEEEARRVPVPVRACIDEAVARVMPAADLHDIRIDVEEPDARLSIMGDRRQLVSAVFNLLENAVKYSDSGSTVSVRARTNGVWVDLAVADHGIGIPRRDLERVFERFYRVDRGRSRETGGTGLGLAIVRHVAGNHDGEVQVESQEGAGSTFTLRLPAGPGPVVVSAEAG